MAEKNGQVLSATRSWTVVLLVAMALIGAMLGMVPAAGAQDDVTMLSQEDFRFGTYIIDQPGTYVLAEDISFNPNSPQALTEAIDDESLAQEVAAMLGMPNPVDAYHAGMPLFTQFAPGGVDRFTPGGPMDARYDPAGYGLGFFAAVVIAAADVTLDLNGHTLEQSAEHALLQRFFSLIELADQPFIPAQGPADFGEAINAAKNVRIKNGILGRSSHHGIHGNANRNVRVSNVDFVDYEVGAIALNGVDGLVVRDVNATNRKDVPVLGTFSSGQFIKAYLDELVRNGSETELTVAGVQLTGESIRDELQSAINNTHKDLVADPNIVDGRAQIDRAAHPTEFGLFHNELGLVDGNSYSFLLNHIGVAVDGFPTQPDGTTRIASKNITFRNVHVKDQEAFINEIVAINQNGKAVIDPVGAVFQVFNVDPVSGDPVTVSSLDDADARFVGNPVANAQAFVAKAFHQGEFGSSRLDLKRLNITEDVVGWIEGSSTLAELLPADGYLCNGDSMFHVDKGVIGFKIDSSVNVSMKNTSVDGLHNFGKPGSTRCGTYGEGRSHPKATLLGYGGTFTRAYTFAGSRKVRVRAALASDISAAYGPAIGIDILTNSSDVKLTRVRVNGVEAGVGETDISDPSPDAEAAGFRIGVRSRGVRSNHSCARALVGQNGTRIVDDESGRANTSKVCKR